MKKAIRIISHSTYLAHTSPIFKELLILKFDDLYLYYLIIFMFRTVKLKLNSLFEEIIFSNNSSHVYPTRNSNIRLPLYSKSLCQNSVFYQGPFFWNELPENLKNIKSIHKFKRLVKESFICKY